jgi:hypothetical protein
MFKKGMLFYSKKVDDVQMGHQVEVTARVFSGAVDNVTYDNPFMSVPQEFQALTGKTADEIKAQGYVLTKACLEDDELPDVVEQDEVDLFENTDVLERPTVLVDLNWRFYDAIVAVENAGNDDERINALINLGEIVYFAAQEED